jgi:hypothetical protein
VTRQALQAFSSSSRSLLPPIFPPGRNNASEHLGTGSNRLIALSLPAASKSPIYVVVGLILDSLIT